VNFKSQFVFYTLWIGHPVLQSIVAAAMIRKKTYRAFPFFFAYVVWQILTFAVIFPIYRAESYELFFYASWTTSAVSVALGFKVIHEIFVDIFRPYHTLKDLGSVLFKWAGLVMLLVAGVVAASNPVSNSGPLVEAIITLQRSVRVVQVGLVLFLLFFSRYLGISWKQRSFGIALGFGIFAASELGAVALNAGYYLGETVSNYINMCSYNCAIVTWAIYSLMKSPERQAAATLLRSQRWERSLTDLQHPAAAGAANSLIPLFENMVDRAFSRTGGGSSSPVQPEGPGEPAVLAKTSISRELEFAPLRRAAASQKH
jgi:hypothetical protein